MFVKNTTTQNKSKQSRLRKEHTIPTQNVKTSVVANFLFSLRQIAASKEEILFSIGVSLLGKNNNNAVKKFLNEYKELKIVDLPEIPKDEFDLLGSTYQYLNTKLENLEKGTFYTGRDIAKDIVKDLDFSSGQIIFDPACGSGAFLFNSDAPPEQLVGVDFDHIAVMLAKFNYFIKFPDASYPKIYHSDFFKWFKLNSTIKYDYIIGNPPYGANIDIAYIPSKYIVTGESFSYFIEYSFSLLKSNGILRFLLPEAILNVKRHADIRNFILNETNLTKIVQYNKKFSGVMSDVYLLELNNGYNESLEFHNNTTTVIPKAIYHNLKNNIFAHFNKQDIEIIEKVNKLKKFDLSDSIFGLGVVTGDNKSKIFKEKLPLTEHIYTGKEVAKYKLLPPKNYLVFDRNNLQQVAPDSIYRAKKKLVYKTINKYLKVAIDLSGSLTSNSANIIIPNISGLDIYTVMALLNSNAFSYLHLKLFGGVNKIAKENLMALPFPEVKPQQNIIIKNLVQEAMDTDDDTQLQNYINVEVLKFKKDEIKYINSIVEK